MIIKAILPTPDDRRYIVIGRGNVDPDTRFYVLAADGLFYKQEAPIVAKGHWFLEIVTGWERDEYAVVTVSDGHAKEVTLAEIPDKDHRGTFVIQRRGRL